MSTELVRGDGLCYSRFGREILNQADLAVSRGEIVTLIGPNGAGKSTLIRIILGLLKPDRGSVWYSPALTMGYMPQKLSIDTSFPLSVARFVAMAGKNPEQLERCLALTGAESLRHQAMHSLSGGETQRVLLARALYRQPQLLVLDEPVQGVDINGQAAMYQLIGAIRDQWGCGILMVSHDLHLVMSATDRVVCLNQHICCEGHPDQVSHDPEFLRLFGASHSQPIAHYTHHHDHDHDDFRSTMTNEPESTSPESRQTNREQN